MSSEDGTGDRKLAEVVAEAIESEIIDRGWPVGEVLGSETDLLERYKVSRAVFREAVGIVHHHGVAMMRRGPGGGLVVSEPDIEAVVRAMVLLLEFQRIDPVYVHETRKAIELDIVELAAVRCSEEAAEALQQHLTDEVERIKLAREEGVSGRFPANDFHMMLADLTGNPSLGLFLETITTVQGRQSPRAHSLEALAREVQQAHQRIADAIIAGDAGAARRRMARHLDSVLGFIGPREAAEEHEEVGGSGLERSEIAQ